MRKRARPFNTILFSLLILTVATACSTGPRARPNAEGGIPQGRTANPNSTSGSSGTPTQPNGQYGPSATDANTNPPVYGPVPTQLKPITLVFGPGMARGFAHVGVLRAFTENRIPIGAIYGMEMGSLIGALYASDSNLNRFELNLMKIKDELFLAEHGLMGRIFNSGETIRGDADQLESQLRRIFGRKDISQAKTPVHIEIQRKAAPSPTILDKGPYVSVLRASIAAPGFFGPGSLDGQPTYGASDSQGVTFLCAEARAQTGGPIILIDTAIGRNDPSAADLVIRPDLEGIAITDFSKKTDAAFRGKKAVEEHLPELKRWAGIPVDTSTSQEGSTP